MSLLPRPGVTGQAAAQPPAAGAAPAEADPPATRGPGLAATRAWLLRAVAHVVTWVPFFFAVGRSIQQNWIATSDNAVIALRSWDVLSTHAPLVGQASRFGFGVFDLGPVEYWLLTVPVHLDAVHGMLWGAALWCMIAASLTVEAAWSVGREYLALAASAAVLGMLVWNPEITTLPCWNPWFGIMFFLAEIAAAWAVMVGRRGWWPVVVIAGSIATQAHLMFAIAAVGIVALTLAVGLRDNVRANGRYRWVVAGVIAGAICWSAPLLQQFTSRHGNMAAILSGKGTAGTKAGLGFGLKAISAATQPPAYWWQPILSLQKFSRVEGRSALAGLIAVGLLAVALLIAIYLLRCRWAAALAGLALVLTGAALITYSDIRLSDIQATTPGVDNLRYLMAPMYPLGLLSWLAVISVAVLLVRRALSPAGRRAAASAGRAPGLPGAAGAPAGLRFAGVAAAAVLAVSSVSTGALYDWQRGGHGGGNFIMNAVVVVSRQVERDIGRQRIAIKVTAPDNAQRRQLTMGLAYALRADGYHPVISPNWGLQLGAGYRLHGQRLPEVAVTMRRVHTARHFTLATRVLKTPMPRR